METHCASLRLRNMWTISRASVGEATVANLLGHAHISDEPRSKRGWLTADLVLSIGYGTCGYLVTACI